MFTGIITHLGKLNRVENSTFIFQANRSFCKTISKGSSAAVNGVCLTVSDSPKNNSFSIEIMPETRKKTTLGSLKIGNLVNLELPVSALQLLSGHLVQGHVDGVGQIKQIEKEDNSLLFTVTIPSKLSKYIVEKGSIAVNGISLTIIKATSSYFTVGIIPFTFSHTMLSKVSVGDLVNIEVDILAKYLEKLISKRYE